jgi:flagellar export protein FliJ
MPQYHFRLAALQRYREHLRDVCRQELAALLAQDAALAQQRDEFLRRRTELLAEMRDLQQQASLNVDHAASRRYHAGQLAADARLAEWRRQQLAALVAACRQRLVLADQGVKVLERLSDKQRTEFEAEQEKQESRQREEIWQAGQLVGRSAVLSGGREPPGSA